MLVRARMTGEVITASPETTLAEALKLTRQHRIRHLPVVEGKRLVGLVTERDLRLAVPPAGTVPEKERQKILDTKKLEDLMVREMITTTPITPVEDAAKLLYEHKIGCLPVLDGKELVGILTETDLLRAFVELFGGGEPSTRIEVRMPNRPGELSRVIRLIGIDFKININGLVTPRIPGKKETVAVIHLETQRPEELIEALEKMGYEVGWPSLDLKPEPAASPAEPKRPARSFDAEA